MVIYGVADAYFRLCCVLSTCTSRGPSPLFCGTNHCDYVVVHAMNSVLPAVCHWLQFAVLLFAVRYGDV